MKRQTWQERIEQFRDGELPDSEAEELAAMLEEPAHRDYDASLAAMSTAAQGAMPRGVIADEQLPAFVAGIREGIDIPRRGHRGFWALASLSTAALIVSLSVFSVIMLNSQDAVHSTVEAAASEIEGVEIDTSYMGEDGTAVVWVSDTGSDTW